MQGKWFGLTSRFYYASGALYYLYRWVIITGAFGILTSTIPAYYKQYWLLFIIIQPAIAVFIWGTVLWIRTGKYQLQGNNPNLKDLLVERTYTVLGDRKYEYYRKVITQALETGADHYTIKFWWSGKGKTECRVSNPHQKIQLSKQPHGNFTVCRVTFERPLKKGETEEINFHINFLDEKGKPRSFLLHDTHDKIRKLVLKVRVPINDPTQAHTKQCFMSPVSEIPMWEAKDQQFVIGSGYKEASWEIPRPRFGYRYQICW
jgi:hypothetical protein